MDVLTCQGEKPWTRHVWWMFSVLVSESAADRDGVMDAMRRRGIETRPFVHPLHTLPPYREASQGQTFPVAEAIARSGINLPTFTGLTRAQVRQVAMRCSSAWLR